MFDRFSIGSSSSTATLQDDNDLSMSASKDTEDLDTPDGYQFQTALSPISHSTNYSPMLHQISSAPSKRISWGDFTRSSLKWTMEPDTSKEEYDDLYDDDQTFYDAIPLAERRMSGRWSLVERFDKRYYLYTIHTIPPICTI